MRIPPSAQTARAVLTVGAMWLVLASLAAAQSAIETKDEYSKRVKQSEAIAPLGDDLFGDSTNYYTGATSFSVTDVSLPGNSALPVAITRRHVVGADGPTAADHFGEWTLDVPSISSIVPLSLGWQADFSDPGRRCSGNLVPRNAVQSPRGSFGAWEYWSGLKLSIPGGGEQSLVTPAAGIPRPEDGRNYVLTTTGRWFVSCLPSIKNGTGEGFLAISPEGVRYFFDWIAYRRVSTLVRPVRAIRNMPPSTHELERARANMYVTRVEDRFGNWVNYNWSGNNLVSIEANDGRRLDLSYVQAGAGANAGPKIGSVSDGSRTWSYGYTGSGFLSTVTQPDGHRWLLSTTPAVIVYRPSTATQCGSLRPGTPFDQTFTYRMTHPSGAVGEWDFRAVRHGRSRVPIGCRWDVETNEDMNESPGTEYMTLSLTQKRLSGIGIAARSWSVAYGAPNGSLATCTTCPTHRDVTVTDSSVGSALHRFSNEYGINEGRLLRIERFSAAGVSLEVVDTSYLTQESGQGFLRRVGNALPYRNADPSEGLLTPELSRVMTRDATTFRSENRGFDVFARPVAVAESGPNGSRTTTRVHFDDRAWWVLGQTASTSVSTAGGTVENSRAEFNALSQPVRLFSFGLLQQSLSYHPDGTVLGVTDARGNSTTLTNWYRGVPRQIRHPDGTTMSATVTPQGWLSSVTDQNGFTTSYSHDALGRLTGITPPSGDAVAYAGTWVQFKPLDPTVDWMPPGTQQGMWRRLQGRGHSIRATYFDALYRPVLELEYDHANIGGTMRSTRTAYDAAGRVSFQSRAIGGAELSTSGTRTEYDALGRVTRVTQDSEQGPLVTTTEYLSGLRTRVTNPRGQQTTTAFMAFGEPSTDWPIEIAEPEGRTTRITRDVFGKPLTITRSGNAGESLTRRYVYDAAQRLCKQLDPETGATVFDYDAAGNVAWRVSGSPLTANQWCDRGNQPAADVTRFSYDALNRVVLEDRPGSEPDLSTAYTPDGLIAERTVGANRWLYQYNRLRLPTLERLDYAGGLYDLQWAYDTLGHRSSLTMAGVTVDYAPNALGQPTRAGSYASAASYFPDGSLQGYTLGNGVRRTVQQNTRGLADRIRDVAANGSVLLDDAQTYDPSGNVLTQSSPLGQPGTNRDMQYDGLDRLTRSHVHGLHIDQFSYNALDNITQRQFFNGFVNQVRDYQYDANNRLLAVNGPGAGQVFGTDARGNITWRNWLRQTFNSANQLIQVETSSDAVTTFDYDGYGRRTVTWRPDGTAKIDVYDAAGVLRLASDNRRLGATFYIHLGPQLVAEHFRRWDGSAQAIEYVHTDFLGSAVLRSDAAGNPSGESDRFTAFGQAMDGRPREAPGYTGHMEDPDLGLTYMQQRYYDPAIGRFLSVDPVGPLQDPLQHFGRYQYAYNNPYRYTDPDGRCPHPVCLVVYAVGLLTYSEPANAPAPGQVVEQPSTVDAIGAVLPPARAIAPVRMAASAAGSGQGRSESVNPSGRNANKVSPDSNASGAHSTVKRDADGNITNTATYEPNARNPSGFQEVKRVDVVGGEHRNPDGTVVPTPHVKEAGQRGVRPATPEELPRRR